MGDAMPGSNFDDVLSIDSNGRVVPQGPLGLPSGATDIKVYAWVTQQVKAVADRHADGRVVSVLEGGYSMPALGRSACAGTSWPSRGSCSTRLPGSIM